MFARTQSVVRAEDDDGNTLMHVASYRGNLNLYKMMFFRGADLGAKNKGTCDLSGGFSWFNKDGKRCRCILPWESIGNESRTALMAACRSSWTPDLFIWHMTYDIEHDRDQDVVDQWLRVVIKHRWKRFGMFSLKGAPCPPKTCWVKFVSKVRPNLLQAKHWMQLYLTGESELDDVRIADISEWHEVNDMCENVMWENDERLSAACDMLEVRREELLTPF